MRRNPENGRHLIGVGGSAVLVLAAALVLLQPRDDASSGASRSLTDAELVACSNGIGSGVIADVSVAEAASEVRLTLTVEE